MRKIILIGLLFFSFNINAQDNHFKFDQDVLSHNIKIAHNFEKSKFYNKNIKFESSGEKIYFSNKNNDQILILDFCCGGSSLNVQRIIVTTPNRLAYGRLINKLNVEKFITQNQNFIGMHYADFVKNMGVPKKQYNDKDSLILKYYTEDQNSPLLRNNNMPSYYALYKFNKQSKILTGFEFGFSDI
ncbi:hypothetical protein [Acinetobacter sp. MB5]|uniref:hypothetical protein n=1 Tax=Acinetobacter sp. MB5 TaxID=2069438 RepID=UPI000DCF837B|nr:hypothetical protein [Acinetobacter sp. MB5]